MIRCNHEIQRDLIKHEPGAEVSFPPEVEKYLVGKHAAEYVLPEAVPEPAADPLPPPVSFGSFLKEHGPEIVDSLKAEIAKPERKAPAPRKRKK